MAASSPPIGAPNGAGSTDIEMMEASTTSSKQRSPDQETFTRDGHDRSALKSETTSTHPEDENDSSKLVKQPGEPSSGPHRRDDGVEYPRGVKLSLIVLALCLAVFLMALEYSVRPRSAIRLTDFFVEATP